MVLIHGVDPATASCSGSTCPRQVDVVDTDGSGRAQTIASIAGLSYVQFRPPAGGELLYRAIVDGKWGLFSMDLHGTRIRTVVPATVPAQMDATFGNAVYSPDGRRVFFDMYTEDASQGQPGCCQLFTANADGGDIRQFIPNTGGAWDGVASVSPDGSKIAFWHNLSDRTTHRVTVVNSDGSGPLTETGPELANTAHWVWAPDSSTILMYPDDDSSPNAFLLDPAGGQERTVPWISTGDLDWQRVALP